jgi:2-oxoglutarate dehydrogenase E2 component (dihydrolipoamide succinyltransferase)
MRVDVVMPQMGESIAEGTITKWIKAIGQSVQRDEPLFEISTDKVDAEIPSPAAGVLVEIKNKEGETVPVNQVVAVIETEAGAAKTSAPAPAPPAAAPAPAPKAEAPKAAPPAPARPPAPEPKAEPRAETGTDEGAAFVSPVVRKIAAEHGLDPARVPGTGSGGRVTKKDILDFVARGDAKAAPAAAPAPAKQPSGPSFAGGARTERVPMSAMRKKIAEHMIESRRTSAHVHSVFEVDMTRAVKLREKYRGTYEQRYGTKLTFMPFFVKVVCDALRAWPVLNSSIEGEEIVYRKEINIGIAVALDWGLIVPVVRNADELSISGLAKKINDLGERARAKKLNPDEVQGGTFTLTNPGVFGGLFGLPIINQPQVGILGIGGIAKRPVVIDDAIAIRSMIYLSMSYDHRVVDGAVADQFLAQVKKALENFDESML